MEGLRHFIESKQTIAPGLNTTEVGGYRKSPFDLDVVGSALQTSFGSSENDIMESNQRLDVSASGVTLPDLTDIHF